jgi:hypothetical protein
MATAKKVRKPTRAAKMREYFTANPTATVTAVAKKFKTTYQIAYMTKKSMEPKKIVLNPAQLAVIKKSLEVPKVKAKPTLWQPPALLPVPEITMTEPKADPVNHPAHYKVGGIETIDFIEAKSLGYNLGNVVKYVSRADHKGERLENLEKARWYLDREIGNLSEKLATQRI